MKIKSHKINWAIALCAVAVFSLTAVQNANADYVSISGSDAAVTGETDPFGQRNPPQGIEPVRPAADSTNFVGSGSYNGTVMAD
ncbi:MAG TPA: hypothetical protein VM940_08340 [Chthoniobacterales bacterium]|nr:hypothetical protein [Chthoniobacterales bacterium]